MAKVTESHFVWWSFGSVNSEQCHGSWVCGLILGLGDTFISQHPHRFRTVTLNKGGPPVELPSLWGKRVQAESLLMTQPGKRWWLAYLWGCILRSSTNIFLTMVTCLNHRESKINNFYRMRFPGKIGMWDSWSGSWIIVHLNIMVTLSIPFCHAHWANLFNIPPDPEGTFALQRMFGPPQTGRLRRTRKCLVRSTSDVRPFVSQRQNEYDVRLINQSNGLLRSN